MVNQNTVRGQLQDRYCEFGEQLHTVRGQLNPNVAMQFLVEYVDMYSGVGVDSASVVRSVETAPVGTLTIHHP